MKKTNWYTFKEVLGVYPLLCPNYQNEKRESSTWFMSMLSDANLDLRYFGIKSNSTLITSTKIQNAVNLLAEILFDRHANNYIYSVELDFNSSYVLDINDFRKAMSKIINVINLTMPKYIPLLEEVLKNYEDPLRKLESESEAFSRFNDTPQEEIDTTDFNTGDYATTMGKNKQVSKVDSGSIVARVKEFQNEWKSIALLWSNEFEGVFIEDYQLEDF